MDLGRVSGFYPGGRPSGLPDDIVERLVNAKKMEELDPLQNKLDSVKQTKDVYSKLDSTLVNMAQSAENLNSSDAFQAKSVTSGNEDVVTASVDNTANEGTYNVSVDQLAQAHNHALRSQAHRMGYDDGSGNLTGVSDANDASLISDGVTLSFDHNGSKSITTDSNTTISSLAQTIQDKDWGVRAHVQNIGTSDSPEYTLQMQSEDTGATISSISGEIFEGQTMKQAQVQAGVSDPDDSSLVNADMEVSFHHEGSQYSYSTDSESTLDSLAEAIDSDANGVRASVANQGTENNPSYILSLKSQSTGGGENQITSDGSTPGIQITDTTPDSRSLFAGGQSQEEVQQGLNAKFSVDGVGYERTSNEVSDAIDGVSLTLQGQGSDADMTVDKDISSVTKEVQSFVDTFNQTNGFIEKQSDYNKDTEQAGPLMGSSVARSAETRMSRILMEPISGTSDNQYQYLNQVGIELQRDGSVEFDSDKFQSAMEENPLAVEKLFVGDSGAAGKMESALKEGFTDDIDGAVPSKIESIDNRIDRINEQITQEERDLQNYRERTVQKFSNMEQAIMKYQSIESQLGNWLDLGKDDKA